MLANRPNESIVVADVAIPVMERLDLIEELLQTLVNKGSALGNAGRWLEGSAILRGTIELLTPIDMTLIQPRAINNLYSSTVNDVLYDPELFIEFSALVERSGSAAWINRLWYNELEAMVDSGLLDGAGVRIAMLAVRSCLSCSSMRSIGSRRSSTCCAAAMTRLRTNA